MQTYLWWLIVAIIFIIVEIFTAGFFYACFAIGALGAMIAGYFGAGIVWQIVVFCVVSVGLIPITRIFARKVSDDSVPQAGADALIGYSGMVIETIDKAGDGGKVKVDGQVWRAVSIKELKTGVRIKVIDVKGAKMIVEEHEDKGDEK